MALHKCTHCDGSVDDELDFLRYDDDSGATHWSHVDCSAFGPVPRGTAHITSRRYGYMGVWHRPPAGSKAPIDLLDERAQTHGDYNTTALIAQGLKSVIEPHTKHLSSAQCESIDLICTKLARVCSGNPNESDHWRDIEGYARLITRMLEDE